MSRRFDTGCLVEVIHRFEELGAHVRLDGDVALRPGDRVTVHGPQIRVPFGEARSRAPSRDGRARGPLARVRRPPRLGLAADRTLRSRLRRRTRMTIHQRIDVLPGDRPRTETTEEAKRDTLLNPRFYTTDFDALDKTDVLARPRRLGQGRRRTSPRIPTGMHFKRNANWVVPALDSYPPELASRTDRFPRLLAHRRIFGLRALQGDEAARIQSRYLPALRLYEPRREPPCGFHQRCAEGFRDRRRSGLPDAREEIHLLQAEIHLLRDLSVRRRSAMRATSRSSAHLEAASPSAASTRSSTGSRNGATTSSATARRSRC